MRVHAFAAVALLSGSSAIAQQLPSLYGIQLGTAPTMQECPRRLVVNSWSYDVVVKDLCYSRNLLGSRTPDTPLGDEVISVQWPTFGGPEIAYDSRLSARLVGGVVHRIEITTHGHAVQEKAFEQLLAKFGKPIESRTIPLQNRMGAKYEAITASWRDGAAYITLLGLTTSIDRGSVIVETQTGRDAEKAVWDKINGPRPKM